VSFHSGSILNVNQNEVVGASTPILSQWCGQHCGWRDADDRRCGQSHVLRRHLWSRRLGKDRTGLEALTGVNTYEGGTTIDNGALRLDAARSIILWATSLLALWAVRLARSSSSTAARSPADTA